MTDVRRAQTWTCDEAQADPDSAPAPHDGIILWPDYPRFSAVVDRVEGDVAELVVGTSNSHPRAPDLGDRVDIHVGKLHEQQRWSLKSDAASIEDGTEDPPLVTDGGQCVGSTDRDHQYPDHGPECCVEGCDNNVPGLKHGYEPSTRKGTACNHCWDFLDAHGHWSDKTDDSCELCADTDHQEGN